MVEAAGTVGLTRRPSRFVVAAEVASGRMGSAGVWHAGAGLHPHRLVAHALASTLAAPVNILFLSADYPPNLVGGVGIYTCQFARYLAERGHQAFVVTRTEGTPCEYVDHGVRVWRVRPQRVRWLDPIRERWPLFVGRLEYSIAVAGHLRQILRRYPIDVVESCESRTEGFWYFLWHRRPKLFVKLHTPDAIIFRLNQQLPSKDLEFILAMEAWWLRRATRLVGLTDALIERVGQLYQLQTDQISKVRLPVDTNFFRPNPRLKSMRDLRVLYVGRLEFRKGVHVLLRAIPRVLEAVPQAHFILIGNDDGLQSLLEVYRSDPRTQGSIDWRACASREELREAYQRAHVCVVPSLWENHPIVCLEAMACGCPVVASRVGGIPEIVQHDVNGSLVSAGSSYALAKALIALLTDARKREDLGLQARMRMEQRYEATRVLDETIALYERLLNGTSGHVASHA